MTKQEIINWATEKGYTIDKFGHLKKIVQGTIYRIKLQKNSVRYELKSGNFWIRLNSGYLKDAYITEMDKLGFRR